MHQVVQLLLGGLDCAAVLVTEHTDQADVQFLDRVLQRGDNRAIDELPGGAHGEQVAQALIKNDFRRYARVRAGEHRGIRVLAIKQRLAGLCHGWSGLPSAKRRLPCSMRLHVAFAVDSCSKSD